MATGALTGAAHQRNGIALVNMHARMNQYNRRMTIQGFKAVAVVNFNKITIATIRVTGHFDCTGCRSHDRRTVIVGNIDTGMEFTTAANRIRTITERRRNNTFNRLNGRRRNRSTTTGRAVCRIRNGLQILNGLTGTIAQYIAQ